MKKLLTMLVLTSAAHAATAPPDSCPVFDAEQEWVLDVAYHIALPYGLQDVAPAIAWRETFNCHTGDSVCRENHNDGDYGSYGIMQVQVSTALWMLQRESRGGWEDTDLNRQTLRQLLTDCDTCAAEFGVKYLDMHRHRGVWGMVAKYRGTGALAWEYADDVTDRMEILSRCYFGE